MSGNTGNLNSPCKSQAVALQKDLRRYSAFKQLNRLCLLKGRGARVLKARAKGSVINGEQFFNWLCTGSVPLPLRGRSGSAAAPSNPARELATNLMLL